MRRFRGELRPFFCVDPDAKLTAMDCLSADDLVAMADGELPPTRSDAIVEHVDHCEACADLVAGLAAFDDRVRVGRYELERVIGSGGMGLVYAAWDPQLRRRVAVKLVRPDRALPDMRARMLREARALARINHANVVAVYDSGEHDGEIFIATELVDGTTMHRWQTGRSTHDIVMAWVQVARGLAACHAEGVVHRDVKPGNVLVADDGRVRIGDFGLARAGGASDREPPMRAPTDDGITAPGGNAGTPAYMAPEQYAGVVDARADQFSLCVALAEALLGRRPAADDAIELPDAALAAAIGRGLRRDPDERFPSITELADALAAAVEPRRRRALWIAVGLACVAVASSIIYVATRPAAEGCRVVTPSPSVWSPARHDELERAVPFGLSSHIEAWLASWTAASATVCTANEPPELAARRRRCLDDALAQLDALVASWLAARPQPLRAHADLDRLPHAIACSATALAATPEPSPDRARVIARIRADATTASELRAIATDPRTEHAAAVVAWRELVEREMGHDHTAAVADARREVAAAEASGEPIARLEAGIDLVMVSADDATALAPRLHEQVAQLGGDPGYDADIDWLFARHAQVRGDRETAAAAFERARRNYRIANGPDNEHEAASMLGLAGAIAARDGVEASRALVTAASAIFARTGIPWHGDLPVTPAAIIEETRRTLAEVSAVSPSDDVVIGAEINLGRAYVLGEQPADAIEHYRRAHELADKLGTHDGRELDALAQHASLLRERGDVDAALPIARHAVELARQLTGGDDELALALTVYGNCLVDRGKLTDARAALEEGLAIRERRNASAVVRSGTRFALARALPAGERRRATDLARAARVDLAGALAGLSDRDPNLDFARRHLTQRIAAIDTWLAAH